MNPLVTALAGAAVRWLITFAAARGITLADDQASQLVYGAIAGAMLLWSFRHKKKVDARLNG